MRAFLDWHGWDYATILAGAVGLHACTLFVYRYWRDSGPAMLRNPFGRYLLVRKLLLAGLFILTLANRLSGAPVFADRWPGQSVITFLLFGAFAVHTYVPYGLLHRAQDDAHRNQEATQ